METANRPRIMILGAGFAGINTARELTRLLPKAEDCEITLVDQNNFMVFTPMLTEVVGGEVKADDIINAVQHLSPRIRFVQGRVDGIDLARKRVTLARHPAGTTLPEEHQVLEADYLVIALGSVTAFHGVAGVKEHALTLDSVGDAATIRNQALELLSFARTEDDADTRREALTFVVAGGGFSGVETIAALNDLVRDVAKATDHLDEDEIRCVLIETGKRLLPELSPGLARYAQRKLAERGVEVLLNTRITQALPDAIELEGNRRIPTRLLVWAAGVTPSPVIGVLDVRRGQHGGIVVDACCAVQGYTGVWAMGDCGEVPMPGGHRTYAATAQNATREGTRVARNIVADLHGEGQRPFVYTPIGELALVGKRSGVASVYGLHLCGLIAWALWRGIYLAKMPRLGKRLHIGLDWLLDALGQREIAEMPITRSHPG